MKRKYENKNRRETQSGNRHGKEMILEACLSLFNKYGYGSVNLTSVANEAKTTKQRVMYYFPTPKDAIVELAQKWGETGRAVTMECLAASHSTGIKKVSVMAAATFEWMRRFPDLSRLTPVLFQTAPYVSELGEIQKLTLATGRARILQILEVSPEFSSMTKKDLTEVSRAAHSIMIGGALYVIAMNCYRDMKPYEDACLMALVGLLSRKCQIDD